MTGLSYEQNNFMRKTNSNIKIKGNGNMINKYFAILFTNLSRNE